MQPRSVPRFYDALAGSYHLIFEDWRKSVMRQGAALHRLVRSMLGDGSRRVLDCTCGIGTQAIGLAGRGHAVHATDVSAVAVERAEKEAASFGVALTTGVADVRELAKAVPGTFEVVITCDNSLPHLLTDEDLSAAARAMRAKLEPGGLLVASIRDYDGLALTRPRTDPPRVFDDEEGTRVVLQVWDWAPDARTYTLHHLILRAKGDEWTVASAGSTGYRALLRAELADVLEKSGFAEITWHSPDETGFFQPIVTARSR